MTHVSPIDFLSVFKLGKLCGRLSRGLTHGRGVYFFFFLVFRGCRVATSCQWPTKKILQLTKCAHLSHPACKKQKQKHVAPASMNFALGLEHQPTTNPPPPSPRYGLTLLAESCAERLSSMLCPENVATWREMPPFGSPKTSGSVGGKQNNMLVSKARE